MVALQTSLREFVLVRAQIPIAPRPHASITTGGRFASLKQCTHVMHYLRSVPRAGISGMVGRTSAGMSIGCSGNSVRLEEIERLKGEVSGLEQERDTALSKGRTHSQRIDKLAQRRDGLVANASAALKANNDTVAREILKEKADVVEAIKYAEERARVNFSLAAKLDNVIGQKQKDLLDMITAARRELESGAASASSQSQTSSGARPSRPLSDAEAERAFRDLEVEVGVQRMVEERRLSTDADVNGAFLRMERRMLEDMLAAGGARDPREGVADPPRAVAQSPPAVSIPAPSQETGPATTPTPKTVRIYAGPPRWWTAGEGTLQTIRARFEGTSDEECRVSAQEASVLLARLADTFKRQGDAKIGDMVDLIKLSQHALSRDFVVRVPLDFAPSVRAGLYRVLITSCLTALYKEAPLVPYSQDPRPLTGQQAQAYAVAMAGLLKLSVHDAARVVDAAVATNARGVLLDAIATMKQRPTTDGVWQEAVVAARALQRVLAALSPPANSEELKLVANGLRGFIKESEARCLVTAYRSLRLQGELEEEQAGLAALEAALPLP